MKRRGYLLVIASLVIFLIQGAAFGQFGIRKGVKFGYNFATLSGDQTTNVQTRKAITGGIGFEFGFLGLLSAQTDVLYSPKGVVLASNNETCLNYLSLQFVLKKKFFPVGIHPYLLAGPEFSYLLSAKSAGNSIKDKIKSQDLAAVVGGGLEFSFLGKSIYIEGRYCYGLDNISKEEETSSKNRVSQIFVGLLL